MRYSLMIATALTLASSAAMAQNSYAPAPVARNGEVIESEGSGAIAPVLSNVETKDGISYLSGGVGDEEEAMLKRYTKEFNTHLLLTSKAGEYMGEVSLRFVNSNGQQVLNIDGVGPYFYANLPTDTYTVEAVSSRGVERTAKVKVTDSTTSGKTHIRF